MFSDKAVLESQDWFTKLIKYVEKWVLSGQVFEVFEEKKSTNSCGCPALSEDVTKTGLK